MSAAAMIDVLHGGMVKGTQINGADISHLRSLLARAVKVKWPA